MSDNMPLEHLQDAFWDLLIDEIRSITPEEIIDLIQPLLPSEAALVDCVCDKRYLRDMPDTDKWRRLGIMEYWIGEERWTAAVGVLLKYCTAKFEKINMHPKDLSRVLDSYGGAKGITLKVNKELSWLILMDVLDDMRYLYKQEVKKRLEYILDKKKELENKPKCPQGR